MNLMGGLQPTAGLPDAHRSSGGHSKVKKLGAVSYPDLHYVSYTLEPSGYHLRHQLSGVPEMPVALTPGQVPT